MTGVPFNSVVLSVDRRPWLDRPATWPTYVIAGQTIVIGILLGLLLR